MIETARTFRISRFRTLTSVILPAATPMIAAGMRVAIGIALVVTVISEMIAGSAGFGYYIVQMQYAMRPEPMYLGDRQPFRHRISAQPCLRDPGTAMEPLVGRWRETSDQSDFWSADTNATRMTLRIALPIFRFSDVR